MEFRPLGNRPILSFVTDGSLTAHGDASAIAPFIARIRSAAAAGIDFIQIRERRLDDRTLAACVRQAVEAVSETNARVLVNDRIDVAVAAGAAGVHLRADSVQANDVRAIVTTPFVVGRSVHSVEDAAAADRAGGCDYLVFGTVFPTGSKPAGHSASGIDELRAACSATNLPVLAIGGISLERIREVAAAGAAGVAAITLFGWSRNLPETVRGVRTRFDT